MNDKDAELIAKTIGKKDLCKLPKIEMKNGGRFIYNNTYISYEGEWKNGMREGHGIHVKNESPLCSKIWQDNSYYEGDWKQDFMNGRGKMVHADGDIYEGEWLNDMAHGAGVYAHSGVLIKFFSFFLSFYRWRKIRWLVAFRYAARARRRRVAG
jgi:hypothetical protein